jgi:hypothetical protein
LLVVLARLATSITGFMFHFTSFGPPEIVGVISLLVLSVAIVAQAVVLIAFVVLGIAAVRKYHPAAVARPLA